MAIIKLTHVFDNLQPGQLFVDRDPVAVDRMGPELSLGDLFSLATSREQSLMGNYSWATSRGRLLVGNLSWATFRVQLLVGNFSWAKLCR